MSWIATTAIVIGLICFVTSVIDMMSNGARYADWAPAGLIVTIICMIVVYLTT